MENLDGEGLETLQGEGSSSEAPPRLSKSVKKRATRKRKKALLAAELGLECRNGQIGESVYCKSDVSFVLTVRHLYYSVSSG